MTNFEMARRNMVDNQLRPNGITDERVIAAMGAVARECFVDNTHQGVAYVDEDIPLGNGRYLMEPRVLALLLQAAKINPNSVVLDIGCGSGYTAAVCARLGATVVAVESDPALAAEATRIMTEHEIDNVIVVQSSMNDGYAVQAPYDVIILSGAVSEIPAAILNQLADGGCLAGVVFEPGVTGEGIGRGVLACKDNGVCSQRQLFDAALPFLPEFEPAPGFSFQKGAMGA